MFNEKDLSGSNNAAEGRGNMIKIRIRADSMQDAEALSAACAKFKGEILLRAGKYCVDAKSSLGFLALMYSSADQLYLDASALGEADREKLSDAVKEYAVGEES